MFEYTFFRIFELLVIIGLLYVAWRFLKADAKLAKKKLDEKLNQEEKGTNDGPNKGKSE